MRNTRSTAPEYCPYITTSSIRRMQLQPNCLGQQLSYSTAYKCKNHLHPERMDIQVMVCKQRHRPGQQHEAPTVVGHFSPRDTQSYECQVPSWATPADALDKSSLTPTIKRLAGKLNSRHETARKGRTLLLFLVLHDYIWSNPTHKIKT